MELFVDDLVECHGDVRVRAMMVLCHWKGFGPNGGSSIYCDTLSVSQYDSKVRSGLMAVRLGGGHSHWTIFSPLSLYL